MKIETKKWIWEEQRKHHRCQCGCKQEIIVIRKHKYEGIPKFISGHQNRKEKYIIKCKQCNKEFIVKPSEKDKPFCSQECRDESYRIKYLLKCKYCSKFFIVLSPSKNQKCCSKECANKILKKSKIKIICQECKKDFYVKPSLKDTSKYCTKECMIKAQRKLNGENHFNWQGGLTNKLYCNKFDNECKESNREKYGRKCFLCGKLEKNNFTKSGKLKKLHVHHIDYNKQQGCNSEWKLVPLCNSCHSKTNGKYVREYYEFLISNILYIKKILIEYDKKIDYRSMNL